MTSSKLGKIISKVELRKVNMKKIFLTLYFVFDFLMSLFPIAFFAWLAAGNWSIMYFLALYLLLTSVAGIVL